MKPSAEAALGLFSVQRLLPVTSYENRRNHPSHSAP